MNLGCTPDGEGKQPILSSTEVTWSKPDASLGAQTDLKIPVSSAVELNGTDQPWEINVCQRAGEIPVDSITEAMELDRLELDRIETGITETQ